MTSLGMSANVNAQNGDGNTALHIAVDSQCRDGILLLTRSGVSADVRNASGETALHLACRHCSRTDGRASALALSIVGALLESGADPDARDSDGNGALHLAAAAGDEGLLEAILGAGADSSIVNGAGDTALHIAARHGHAALMQRIVLWDAGRGAVPLHMAPLAPWAAASGPPGPPDFAAPPAGTSDEDSDGDGDEDGDDEFEDCISTFAAPPPTAPTEDEFTLEDRRGDTHMAIWERFFENALLAKDSGRSRKARKSPCGEGWRTGRRRSTGEAMWPAPGSEAYRAVLGRGPEGTGLLHAAVHGRRDDLERMLAAGAFPDMRDDLDRQPLHHACWADDAAAVKRLVDHGATVDGSDLQGLTPLHVCAWRSAADAAVALLESAADVTVATDAGDTPLHYAAKYGSASVVERLIAYGADARRENGRGLQPIHLLAPPGRGTAEQQRARAGMEALLRRASEQPHAAGGDEEGSPGQGGGGHHGPAAGEAGAPGAPAGGVWGAICDATHAILSPFAPRGVATDTDAAVPAPEGPAAGAVPPPPTDAELRAAGRSDGNGYARSSSLLFDASDPRSRYVDVVAWQGAADA